MERKKILFVIGSLGAGGAEKSLVNQLTLFDVTRYDIYLYLMTDSGLFRESIPPYVNIIKADAVFSVFSHHMGDVSFFIKHPIWWIKKLLRTTLSIMHKKRFHFNQSFWRYWRSEINPADGKYDIAVGYLEGLPDYFAIEKVSARRKIIWIHNEYGELGYNPAYDKEFFSHADEIVTISETCKKNLEQYFPEYHNIHILHNISSSRLIRKMAKETVDEDIFRSGVCNIVSVGRLAPQKNFLLAVDTASNLKLRGFEFKWIIIGEGPERALLQNKIDRYGLQDNVVLIGLKANPYKYIKRADVAVQCSIYEGKSIFAEEAKILNQIFVTTDYGTAPDVIDNGRDGIIVEMTPHSLCEGIITAFTDLDLRAKISKVLANKQFDDQGEIINYYKIYDGEAQS